MPNAEITKPKRQHPRNCTVRKAALRAGCAYWDQQAAMGGRGAMARWVRAGLGQYDYVHFTSPGYKKLAELLFAQLMAEYGKFQKAQAGQ